jgi:hypothetical protein
MKVIEQISRGGYGRVEKVRLQSNTLSKLQFLLSQRIVIIDGAISTTSWL